MRCPLLVWACAISIWTLCFAVQGGPIGKFVGDRQNASDDNNENTIWGKAVRDDSLEWRVVEPLALQASFSSNFMFGLPELFTGNSRVLFVTTITTCLLNIFLCLLVAIFTMFCRSRGTVHCVEKWIEDEKARPYLVTFVTGSRCNAGSKTTVRLTMAGSKKRMQMHVICPYYYEKQTIFRRGAADNFLLDVAGGIGELKNVVVQCSTERPGKESWYLNYVRIVDLKYNVTWYCPCHAWLHSTAHAKDAEGDMAMLKPIPLSKLSLFKDNLWRGMLELHLWARVFTWNRFDSILQQVLNLSLLTTICLSFMFVNTILCRHAFDDGYFEFSAGSSVWRAHTFYVAVTVLIGIIGSLCGWAIRSAQARRSYQVLVAVSGKHKDLGCCNQEEVDPESQKPLKRVASYDINANNSGVSSDEDSAEEFERRAHDMALNVTNSAKPPPPENSGGDWSNRDSQIVSRATMFRDVDETSSLLGDEFLPVEDTEEEDEEEEEEETNMSYITQRKTAKKRSVIRKTWTRVWKQLRPGRSKRKPNTRTVFHPNAAPAKSALRKPMSSDQTSAPTQQSPNYTDFAGKWLKNVLFDLRSHNYANRINSFFNTNQNNRNDDKTDNECIENEEGDEKTWSNVQQRLANDLLNFLEEQVRSCHPHVAVKRHDGDTTSDTLVHSLSEPESSRGRSRVVEKSPLLRQLSDLSIEGIQQELVLGPVARKLSFTLTYTALTNSLATVERHSCAALAAERRHCREIFERIGKRTADIITDSKVTPESSESYLKTQRQESRKSTELIENITAEYATNLTDESLMQVALASLLGVLSDEVVVAIAESVERLRDRHAQSFSKHLTSQLQTILARRLARMSRAQPRVAAMSANPTDAELNDFLLLAFDGDVSVVEGLIADVSCLLATEKEVQLYLSDDVVFMAFARQFLDTVIGNALLACRVHFLQHISALRHTVASQSDDNSCETSRSFAERSLAKMMQEWRACIGRILDRIRRKLYSTGTKIHMDNDRMKTVGDAVMETVTGKRIIELSYSRAKRKLAAYSGELDTRKQVCESHSLTALGRCIVDGSNQQEDQLDILDDVTRDLHNFALHRACATVARDIYKLMQKQMASKDAVIDEETRKLAAIFCATDKSNASAAPEDGATREIQQLLHEIQKIHESLTVEKFDTRPDAPAKSASKQLESGEGREGGEGGEGGEGDVVSNIKNILHNTASFGSTRNACVSKPTLSSTKGTTSLGDIRRVQPVGAMLPNQLHAPAKAGNRAVGGARAAVSVTGRNENNSRNVVTTRNSSSTALKRSASDVSQRKNTAKRKASKEQAAKRSKKHTPKVDAKINPCDKLQSKALPSIAKHNATTSKENRIHVAVKKQGSSDVVLDMHDGESCNISHPTQNIQSLGTNCEQKTAFFEQNETAANMDGKSKSTSNCVVSSEERTTTGVMSTLITSTKVDKGVGSSTVLDYESDIQPYSNNDQSTSCSSTCGSSYRPEHCAFDGILSDDLCCIASICPKKNALRDAETPARATNKIPCSSPLDDSDALSTSTFCIKHARSLDETAKADIKVLPREKDADRIPFGTKTLASAYSSDGADSDDVKISAMLGRISKRICRRAFNIQPQYGSLELQDRNHCKDIPETDIPAGYQILGMLGKSDSQGSATAKKTPSNLIEKHGSKQAASNANTNGFRVGYNRLSNFFRRHISEKPNAKTRHESQRSLERSHSRMKEVEKNLTEISSLLSCIDPTSQSHDNSGQSCSRINTGDIGSAESLEKSEEEVPNKAQSNSIAQSAKCPTTPSDPDVNCRLSLTNDSEKHQQSSVDVTACSKPQLHNRRPPPKPLRRKQLSKSTAVVAHMATNALHNAPHGDIAPFGGCSKYVMSNLRRSSRVTNLSGCQIPANELGDTSTESESENVWHKALCKEKTRVGRIGLTKNSAINRNNSATQKSAGKRRDSSWDDFDSDRSDEPLLNRNNNNSRKGPGVKGRGQKQSDTDDEEEYDEDEYEDEEEGDEEEEGSYMESDYQEGDEDEEQHVSSSNAYDESDSRIDRDEEEGDWRASQATGSQEEDIDEEEEEGEEDEDEEDEYEGEEGESDMDDSREIVPMDVSRNNAYDESPQQSVKKNVADEMPYEDFEENEKHEQASCFGKCKSCVTPKKHNDYDAEEDLLAQRELDARRGKPAKAPPKQTTPPAQPSYTQDEAKAGDPKPREDSPTCHKRTPIYITYMDQEVLKRPCEKCLPASSWYLMFVVMTLVSVGSLVGCFYFGSEMDVSMSYTWLTIVGISILLDIFIIEPLKVVCVAAFMSVFAKMLL